MCNVSSQGIKIITDTNIQVQCAENYRGRIFALCDTVFNVLFVVGLFIGALRAAARTGTPYAVVAGVAAGYLILATGYAVAVPRPPAAGGPCPPAPARHRRGRA